VRRIVWKSVDGEYMRPRVLACAVLAVTILGLSMASPASAATVAGTVSANANWIRTAQLPDGAIAQYVDQQYISPYLANLAAMGLARATEVTGNSSYLAAAWRWLLWYQAHQTASGFVTDYQVVSGQEVSTGDMDSTDAYAGTFLLALRQAWQVSGTLGHLTQLAPGLSGAVAAIEATQDSDGLTWAKPTWHVKYLMDQAETYAGLRAAADMAQALGNTSLAARASDDADQMLSGVGGLWNPSTASFDWAVDDQGTHQVTNWAYLYPDSLEQVWAVAYGLATTDRGQAIMSHFDSAHPVWDRPAALDRFSSGRSSVGYWPVAGLALLQVGQTARAALAASRIQAAATAVGNRWPFTTAIAGGLIELTSGDVSYLSPNGGP
jgi:hypothetical protein